MAKKEKGIPENEIEIAAMYFAMSNCAVLELARTKNLKQEYYNVSGIMEQECGSGLDPERKSWLKDCKKASPTDYVATEWERVKKDWVF